MLCQPEMAESDKSIQYSIPGESDRIEVKWQGIKVHTHAHTYAGLFGQMVQA